MLTCFCPFSSCAARVSYEIVKPTKCPKCNRAFADAFRVATPTPAPQPIRAAEDDIEDVRPRTKSALLAARTASTTRIKPRPHHQDVVHAMNLPPESADPVFPDDGADDYDDTTDPREVRRQARELAASIDPSTIKIGDNDEGVFKFAQFWTEGQSAREAASKTTPKAAKRKGRK